MAGEENGRRDGREVIGSRLAAAELQLRAMQAQLHADLTLTRFDEPVPELDELVGGLVTAARRAAGGGQVGADGGRPPSSAVKTLSHLSGRSAPSRGRGG